MEIKKEEIKRIAKLASLNLSEEAIEKLTKEMGSIIGFADTVSSVDTDGIEVSNNALDKNNVFRKDEVKEFTDTDELLKNCIDTEDHMYKIPKVI